MKGVILAGGRATRLYPATKVVSKQLLPVYDKPMIYYPLSILMLGGIRDVLIISTERDIPNFQNLIGDGSQWGIRITYKVQPSPDGLPQAFILAEDFLDGEPCALMLGDNILYGEGITRMLQSAQAGVSNGGATVFGYSVSNPEEFGIVEFDSDYKVASIEEKPSNPKSHFALIGLYFFDSKAPLIAKQLKPSLRGELEITDMMKVYMEQGELNVELLGRGYAWLDTGTSGNLLNAATFISTIESRQGLKVACLEEIAYMKNWIDRAKLIAAGNECASSDYGAYLLKLADNKISWMS
jgi:glucose-1-phosphate thymidylyltransferase